MSLKLTAKHQNRLLWVIVLLVGVGSSAALALMAFQENMQHFYDPSQIIKGEAPIDRTIRIGGMVTENSFHRAEDSLKVRFDLTDMAETVTVNYTGILPDLFREGQGIVAIGQLDKSGVFQADEVLAKHDENYMPPEVADALKDKHQSKAEY